MTASEQVALWLLLLAVFAAYWTPLIIALARRHNRVQVALVNGFSGWTCVGWFVALALACERRRVYYPQPMMPGPYLVEHHHHYLPVLPPPPPPPPAPRTWRRHDAIPPSDN